MGKIFLILLVALGVALYIPDSRAVIFETTRPALNPGFKWMTGQQMNQIVSDLIAHERVRGRLPTGRGEFDAWLDDRYRDEGSRADSWGTRYQLQVSGSTIRILAAGPDGEFGTDDDLVREGQRER